MARIPFTGLDSLAAPGTILVPNGYNTTQASPEAFGGGVGAAAATAGNQVAQAGGALLDEAARMQAYQDRAAVTEAHNQAQRDSIAITNGDPDDPKGVGFFALQGTAATAKYKDAVGNLAGVYQNARDGLENDRQRELFDRETRANYNSTLNVMAKHNSDQTVAAAKEAQAAGVKLGQTSANNNYTNEPLFQQGLAQALDSQAHLDAMQGLPQEASAVNRAKVISDTYAARVLRVAADDPLAAKAMLDGNLDKIAPTAQTALLNHLQPLVDKTVGNNIIGTITGQGNGPRGSTTAASVADAIHGQESGRATSATSVDGARGGWQIIPATFKQYAKDGENIDNPADNERVGRRIIDDLSQKYGGDPARIAVGYFSGPGNVAPAGSPTPWKEDRKDGNGFRVSQYVQGVVGRLGGGATGDDGGKPVAIGDSLAVGIKQANGTDGGGAVGASPDAVLGQINARGADELRGKTVILSSGISNAPDPTKLAVVQQQIDSLKARGANVTLLGVGNRADLAPLNGPLADLAQKNGVQFQPIQAGADGVHPADYKGVGVGGAPKPANAPYSVPSADDLLAKADTATSGMPLAVQDHVRSGVLAWRNQQDSRLRGDRSAFQREFGNTVAALQDGRDVPPVDENRIRTLYAPEQAEQLVEQQRIATATGNITKSIAFAGPEEIAAMRQDVATGLGPVSKVLAGRRPDAVAVDGAGSSGDGADTYKLRRQASDVLEQRIAARQKMIEADPAAYAAANPALKTVLMAAQAQGATPDNRAAAVHAVLDEQARLGVPEDKRRALPAAQIAGDIQTLTHTDPSKADMGLALQQKAAAYGDAWPEVFGSYVREKLSPQYQALAIMDRPDQVAARGDMQRALAVLTEKKGLAQLRESVGKEAAKTIDDGLDARMEDFKATVVNDSRSTALFDTFRDSVRTLAYYKAMQGDSNALESAYQGVLGQRYDFDGTMRVPKGLMSDVRTATRQAVAALSPESVAPITGNEALTGQDRAKVLVDAAKRSGMWVPSPDDGGLRLIVKLRDGVPRAVQRADGSPVEVRFNRLEQFGPPNPGTPGYRSDAMGMPTGGQ